MKKNKYYVKNTSNIITPTLFYYKDIIIKNTKEAIKIAGSPDRLWPHVKSHKMAEIVKLQMDFGINKFKCATIAEGEMLGNCKVNSVILAYPLVGPNINRFLQLIKKYKATMFYAIADDLILLKNLSEHAKKENIVVNVLVDMNMGMNRTGVPVDKCIDFYTKASKIKGIKLCGFHCYDGHHGIPDINERQTAVDQIDNKIEKIKKKLENDGYLCPINVMGGTPSFPCHAKYKDTFLSPGTLFLSDNGYCTKFTDMPFSPGVAILTRVISHPDEGYFTLDLGYKGIASDPPAGNRGHIVGLDHTIDIGQSEEHWMFKMKEGYEKDVPPIGTELYVIPTHICPTTALYPNVSIVENGTIIDTWEVTARNRKINI